MTERRELPPTGILQEWVAKLGLRHQGVLLTAVRGCDTVPKEDPSKDVTRAFRGAVLHTHCADARKAKSFIDCPESEELLRRFEAVIRSHDHLPHHFLMHLLHAAEIVAYHHPLGAARAYWWGFYASMCNKLHLGPESKEELDVRLGRSEEDFAARQ